MVRGIVMAGFEETLAAVLLLIKIEAGPEAKCVFLAPVITKTGLAMGLFCTVPIGKEIPVDEEGRTPRVPGLDHKRRDT